MRRRNATVGQWLLRHRDHDHSGREREPSERCFLPWRVRNIHLQCGHLGQRHQRDMHGHAGGERQMRHHHRLRRRHTRERNRDSERIAVELRGQLRRHDSSVPQTQSAYRLDLRRIDIQRSGHCDGNRVGWHAALHLQVARGGRGLGGEFGKRGECHLLVPQSRCVNRDRLHRYGNGFRRSGWFDRIQLGHSAGRVNTAPHLCVEVHG